MISSPSMPSGSVELASVLRMCMLGIGLRLRLYAIRLPSVIRDSINKQRIPSSFGETISGNFNLDGSVSVALSSGFIYYTSITSSSSSIESPNNAAVFSAASLATPLSMSTVLSVWCVSLQTSCQSSFVLTTSLRHLSF